MKALYVTNYSEYRFWANSGQSEMQNIKNTRNNKAAHILFIYLTLYLKTENYLLEKYIEV